MSEDTKKKGKGKEKGKEKSEGSSANKLSIVIIALLVLILAGGAGFATYYLMTRNKPTVIKVKEETKEATLVMDEFLVNLSDEGGKRYIKTKIVIAYEESKELPPELEEKKARMRDAINVVLRNQKAVDLNKNEAGIETLRKDIMTRINAMLNKGKITNVYFYDILVQ